MNTNIVYFEDVELGDDIGPITRTVESDQVLEFVSLREPDPKPSRFTSEAAAKEGGDKAPEGEKGKEDPKKDQKAPAEKK